MATSGYSGLDKATPKSGVDLRTLVEATTGRPLDYSQPGEQELVQRVSNAMYGNVGANLDARDWKTIMASSNPLEAAEKALKDMYSDKAYLVANASHVMGQGYLPEQADYTYQQMQGRVGSTYDSNWSSGSQFAGKIDTPGYLAGVTKAANDPVATDAFTASYWKKYGGNPTLTSGGTTVNTGSTNINTGASTPTTSAVYGPDGRSYPSPAAAIAAGVANYTLTKPAGLIANAELMGSGGGGTASRGFMADATSTGNVNPGGLIASQNSQLFNPVTQINLPTGVPNPFRT
jgi:hypothetical protein